MDVEALSLEGGEAIGDDLEPLPYCVQVIESFLEAEVAQVVGTEFVAQEAGELLVLFEESVLPVGAEHMVAMLDLIDDGGQFPAQALVEPDAEDLADAVGGQPPEPDLAASLEDLVDGEVAFEDEVPAVFDLGDGVEAGQIHLGPFFLGELRSQNEGPVIELLGDDRGTQPVGGCLQRSHVVHRQEGVVVLVESDAGALQFPLDEGMAVEPVGGVEGEETGHPHDDRSEHLVADV